MKTLLTVILLISAVPAVACIDDAQKLTRDEIDIYAESSKSFNACLKLLEDEGVNLIDVYRDTVIGARKERPDGDLSPILYSIMVEGKDSARRPTRLYINYNLVEQRFTCEEPTRNIPKSGCF